ncbi:MAG: DNA polymerase I [Lachnospiraceae bacterium]|nr:DNA polymerase I [Lachnospiraceae bacterium]
MEKVVLIDGLSILNRAFYGVPILTNSEGTHTNAVYGFLNIMFKILEEEQPDYLAVAFDVHGPTFRHLMYDAYKGTRKGMPEELREQVPVMKELLCAMGVSIYEQAGLEADDILGTLAKKAEAEGKAVSLISGDRDLLQIATHQIKIRIPKTRMGKTEIEDYYAEQVFEKYGVTPEGFIDLKALMGDTSDNIPGVPKVGEKTAAGLMAEYGSLEGIYAHVEEIAKKSVRESLIENRHLADLSKVLATIKIDSDVTMDYEKARMGNLFTDEAYVICKRLELKNIIKRFDEAVSVGNSTKVMEAFDIVSDFGAVEDIFDRAGKSTPVGLYALRCQAGSQSSRESIYAVALSFGEETVCIPVEGFITEDYLIAQIKELSGKTALSVCGIKDYYPYLQQDSTVRYTDLIIGAYLCNPLKNDYDSISIGAEYASVTVPSLEELTGKKKLADLLEAEPQKLYEYACYQAYICKVAYGAVWNRLEELSMAGLMRDMEMPLSLVLYSMEQYGVKVRKEELAAYGEKLAKRIAELELSIWDKAGEQFNINSPKQLGEILFDKMGLKGGKKTKTGYSTAADVLEKLAPEYPIVAEVLEYRGLAKLKGTYADGLSAFIEEDGRIHTKFQQTVTATGRLSSTDPNLQNIPMRTELGRQIRKVFVPEEGYVLMDADYSQIELRVLAHMSGDEALIEAYAMSEDIHRITASKVFHIPFEEVTDLQRRNAKAVNFGIVYGISSFGLSQDLSISTKEAKEYIDQYFATYPGIKAFLDKLVSDTKELGYVETMYGRRRPVPELKSSNFMQRSFGERIAMNSPIQGTAADIMKLAMIKVYEELKVAGLQSRLILQVHDELVIETLQSEVDEVREILYRSMKDAAKLAVELEVDLHVGDTWYDAK